MNGREAKKHNMNMSMPLPTKINLTQKKSAKENENFYHKVFYVERKHKKTPPFRSEC